MLVITTGGTIGADPYPNPESAPENASFSWYSQFEEDPVKRFAVVDAMFTDNVQFVTMHPRDSKDVRAPQIRQIAEEIAASDEKKVVVTHGSDTVIANARALAFELRAGGMGDILAKKEVTLVVAMVPLLNDPMLGGNYLSDGVAALRSVNRRIHQLRPGIRIIAAYPLHDNQFEACEFNEADFPNMEKVRFPNTARNRFIVNRPGAQLG